MANTFKSASGNRTFGVFSEPLDAGEYIYNKKARASFCVANSCVPAVNVGTQSNLLLFNRSSVISVYPCKNNINKANLNINLLTQLNLSGVPVIQNYDNLDIPTPIVPTTLQNSDDYPYLEYNIDPCGNLFGNDVCGINNFVNYMVYTPNYIINNGTYTIISNQQYNTIIIFNANNAITFNRNFTVNYIVVGGGGGGGGSDITGNLSGGGGGGGGAVLNGSLNVTSNIYNIVIGSGGSGGIGGGNTNGQNGSNGNVSQIILSANPIISANGGQGGIGNSTPLCNGGASGSGTAGGIGGTIFGINPNGTNAPPGGGGGGGGSYYVGNGGNGSLNVSVPIYGTIFGAGGGGGAWDGEPGAGGNSNAGNGEGLIVLTFQLDNRIQDVAEVEAEVLLVVMVVQE
jgi:hypothetical protein